MFKRDHFPGHSHELADKLNKCERYILAEVLRHADGRDCTNSGISSQTLIVFVPHPDGNFSLADLAKPEHIMQVIPPAFDGFPFRFKPRNLAGRDSMFGGNYCVGDSRFMELYGAPIAIHDRVED